MKKIFTQIIKTSKILVLLLIIPLLLTKVNVFNSNDKITNENFNKTLDLTAMSTKLSEIQLADIYYPLDTFTGDVTGYSADCPLCSGYLACNGAYMIGGPTTTFDKDYGEVQIVASSKNLPCGSIITYEAPYNNGQKVIAIVLDRGVLGNDIDVLVPSENYARENIGRHKMTYDVLRFGYTRK